MVASTIRLQLAEEDDEGGTVQHLSFRAFPRLHIALRSARLLLLTSLFVSIRFGSIAQKEPLSHKKKGFSATTRPCRCRVRLRPYGKSASSASINCE
jgi:hypothetical protein